MDKYIKTKQYDNYKIDFYELNCITENFVVAKYSKYSKQANRLTQQKRIAQVYMNCQIIRKIRI